MQQLAELPSLHWGWLAFPPLLLAWWRPVFLVPVFLIAGIVSASWRADALLADELPRALEGRDLVIEGAVADLPQVTDYGYRFPFDVHTSRDGERDVKIPARILLSARAGEVVPRAGESWRLQVRLKRPHGFQNPGGFDYEAYLLRQGIRARGNVRAWQQRLPSPAPRYAVDRVREAIGERIRAALPDHPQAGIVEALANGHARGIERRQWDVLRRTGTLHLVAISGLHISLVAAIAFFIGRWLWSLPGRTVLWLPAQQAGAIAGFMAAAGYAALAGFVVPTQRALIMAAVVFGALLWRRRFASTQVLAAALLAVLAYDPLAVHAPGFWLSFAAVAVIFLVMREDDRAWWKRWISLQWAIAIGLLPITLVLFQQISLVGPFANTVAIPVFDLLAVPLVLAGIALSGVGLEGVAALAWQAAAGLLNLLWPVLEWLSTPSWGQWWQPQPPAWATVCAVVGVLLLLAPRGMPGRWVGAVWLLPVLLVRPPGPAAGEVWMTLLDVGQGLAVVVRTQHRTVVFDTGPRYSSSFDAGESVVVPYLRQAGVRRIDRLVVSHGDRDHAGGMESLLAALPVDRVMSSVPAIASHERCVAGRGWSWDEVQFEILNPPDGVIGSHNNDSCVLLITSRHGRILLPADIEKKTERWLVETLGRGLQADVLVAPHHGSRSSSSQRFLETVRPRLVLIPVGYRNAYRHPHPAVVERYRALGVRQLDSPAGGAIELRLRAGGMETGLYRIDHRRYWFAR